MPALDQCHEQIVRALEKAGWHVGEGPYTLPVPGRRPLYIDIYAQRHEGARQQTIIIVEAKCFADITAELNDLYTALGQYLIYRSLLQQRGITDDLYLAVPTHAFEGVIQQVATSVITEIRVKMIVVDLEGEVIEQWLK